MKGWIYLIKNGNLYKIGITRNFKNRMRQLKPDNIVAKLYTSDFKQLEREFHRRYRNVRIPQTEYFRLDHSQIRDIKNRISRFCYPMSINLYILYNSICLLLVLFLIVFLIISLNINDINTVVLISLQWMEKISFFLSFLSFFLKSDKYFSFFNELKFRSSRFILFFVFAFFIRYTSSVLF